MYFLEVGQHNLPHVHAEFSGEWAVLEIPSGHVIDGDLPSRKMRTLQAWIELHQEELMERWEKAVTGHLVTKID